LSSTRPSPLRGDHEADVVVLGASLAGLVTALELMKPGRRVAVLEASSVPGATSAADLGHLVTGLALPYTRAVERFGRDEARTLWEWHREGHERLRAWLDALRDDCGHRRNGGFILAADRAEALELADSEDTLREDGFGGEFLDHYMLEARFDVRGFTGAYWAADDGEVTPVALLRALAAFAAAQGVALFEASPASELTADAGGIVARTAQGQLRAPVGVLACASVASLVPGLARWLVPLQVHRLVCTLEVGPSLPSPARSAEGRVAWSLGDDFRAAASRADGAAAEQGFEDLASYLKVHLPAEPRLQGRWAGSLLTVPDGLPLVGFLPAMPMVAALGLGPLGHSWAFVAARWAAESVTGGLDTAPSWLRPSRFPGLSPAAHPQ
jgi:glycine/D-amino acid oxidase-like deaminating enzyme